MSEKQDIKQKQNNLIHQYGQYGLLSLKMEELQNQARQVEQQMANVKQQIRQNIEETEKLKIVEEEIVEEERVDTEEETE